VSQQAINDVTIADFHHYPPDATPRQASPPVRYSIFTTFTGRRVARKMLDSDMRLICAAAAAADEFCVKRAEAGGSEREDIRQAPAHTRRRPTPPAPRQISSPAASVTAVTTRRGWSAMRLQSAVARLPLARTPIQPAREERRRCPRRYARQRRIHSDASRSPPRVCVQLFFRRRRRGGEPFSCRATSLPFFIMPCHAR